MNANKKDWRPYFKPYHDTCGIYGIRNLITLDIYVGKAIDMGGDRWPDYIYDLRRQGGVENKRLQRAWNKYGEEAFEFIVLRDLTEKYKHLKGDDLHNALYKEEVEEAGLHAKLYNLMIPGKGGMEPTKEMLSNLSLSLKAAWQTKETQDRHATAREVPEYKKRQKEVREEYWAKPENHAKHSKASIAAHQRPEVKLNQGNATRRNWANPIIRDKQTIGIQRGLSTLEYKKKGGVLISLNRN